MKCTEEMLLNDLCLDVTINLLNHGINSWYPIEYEHFCQGVSKFCNVKDNSHRTVNPWIPANSNVPKHVLGGSERIRHSHCGWGTVEVFVKDLKHVCIHVYWSVSSGIFETYVLLFKKNIIYIYYSISCVCQYVGFTSFTLCFFHGSVANKSHPFLPAFPPRCCTSHTWPWVRCSWSTTCTSCVEGCASAIAPILAPCWSLR